jgi:hypothetical protein
LARQGCHVSVCEKHLGTRQELRRAGLDVVDEPEDAAGEFDTVILWGVVEHLPDPPRTLASLRRLIAPDGAFAILTEDASCWAARVFGRRWGWLLPPEHTVLFSHQGLEFCLQSVGYGLDDYLRWPTDVRAVMNSLLGRARSQQYRTRFRAERHALTQRAADRSFRAWFVQLAKRGLDTQLWPLSEHKLYRFSRVQR